MKVHHVIVASAICVGTALAAGSAVAAPAACAGLPSQATLQSALTNAVAQDNGGLGFNMWRPSSPKTARYVQSRLQAVL